jgi:hypothetical protein
MSEPFNFLSGLSDKEVSQQEKEYYDSHEDLKLTETEFKTQYGRKVYKDQHGETHSESSITVQDSQGRWMNIPSIYNGEYVNGNMATEIIEGNKYVDPETNQEIKTYETSKDAETEAIKRNRSLNESDQPWNKEETMNKNPSKNWLQQNGPDGHMLAHITPKEGKILQYFGGSGTKDKKTGLKSYFLSGLLGGGVPPKPTTSQTEIDPEVKAMRNKVLDKSSGVMDEEFQSYDDPRFAGKSADTATAQQGVRDMQGVGKGAYSNAAGVGKGMSGYSAEQVKGGNVLGGQDTGQAISDYMNPYTSEVIQANNRNAVDQLSMINNSANAKSQMAGTSGGSRDQLYKATLGSEFLKGVGTTNSGLINDSFANSMVAKRQDMMMDQDAQKYNQAAGISAQGVRGQGAELQMAGTNAGRGAGYQDAQALSQVGADAEGRVQNQFDFDYDEFGRKRDHNKNQAMFGSNIVAASPTGQGGFQSNSMQKGNKLLGAGGAALTAYGASGGNPYIAAGAGGLSLLS